MTRSADVASELALCALASRLAGCTAAVGPARVAQQSAKPPVFTEFRSKLALDGYDAVAYFKTGKPDERHRRRTP